MAKFTDIVEATMAGYFNAGDQPTEAQFTALMAAIQAAIDEHDHAGAAAGDGLTVLEGEMSYPNQPSFSAVLDGDQNILDGAAARIEFDTQIFDVGGIYDPGVGDYKMVAPITGKYLLVVMLMINNMDVDADYYRLRLNTTARNYYQLMDPGAFAGDPVYWPMAITAIADMTAADEAYCMIRQVGGANQASVDSAVEYSRFMGWFLG